MHTCAVLHTCNYLVVYHWFSANRNTSGITPIFVNGQMLQVTLYRSNSFVSISLLHRCFAKQANELQTFVRSEARTNRAAVQLSLYLLLMYTKSILNVYHMWKHLSKCQRTRPTCNMWVGLPSYSFIYLSIHLCVSVPFCRVSLLSLLQRVKIWNQYDCWWAERWVWKCSKFCTNEVKRRKRKTADTMRT